MNDLKEQFSNKINEAVIDDNPFDHLYIENFFEDNLYTKILSNIPNVDKFQKILDTGLVGKNYSPERYIFNLQKDIIVLEQEQQDFWNKVTNAFSSPEFWKSVSTKFAHTIKERFANLSKEEKKVFGEKQIITCRIALIKDYTKYQLGAHTDTPRKLFSFLFYLPKDNSLKKIGTSLYKPIEIIKEEEVDKQFEMDETSKRFETIKTCEFKMNSVFVFARTNYSFHGVQEVNIDQSERNLLLVNFYGDKA